MIRGARLTGLLLAGLMALGVVSATPAAAFDLNAQLGSANAFAAAVAPSASPSSTGRPDSGSRTATHTPGSAPPPS